MTEEEVFGLEDRDAVRKYALQNAIEYSGKGQSGSVLGRVLAAVSYTHLTLPTNREV